LSPASVSTRTQSGRSTGRAAAAQGSPTDALDMNTTRSRTALDQDHYSTRRRERVERVVWFARPREDERRRPCCAWRGPAETAIEVVPREGLRLEARTRSSGSRAGSPKRTTPDRSGVVQHHVCVPLPTRSADGGSDTASDAAPSRPPSRGVPCSRSCSATPPGDAGDAEQADDVEHPEIAPATDGDDRRDGQQADHVHDLDQRVEGRAGGVLQRVATVSPVTAALCARSPCRWWPCGLVLDGLLGVVPGAAGVGHEHGQELAHDDHAASSRQGLARRGRCRP